MFVPRWGGITAEAKRLLSCRNPPKSDPPEESPTRMRCSTSPATQSRPSPGREGGREGGVLEPLWGGRLLLRDQLVFIWRNERSVFTAANTRHRVRALRPDGQRRVNERKEDMKHLHGAAGRRTSSQRQERRGRVSPEDGSSHRAQLSREGFRGL